MYSKATCNNAQPRSQTWTMLFNLICCSWRPWTKDILNAPNPGLCRNNCKRINFCPGLYNVIRNLKQVLHNCKASQHMFCSESLGLRILPSLKSLFPYRGWIRFMYSCSSNLIHEYLSSNEIAQENWTSKSRTKGCVECHIKMTDPLNLVENCEWSKRRIHVYRFVKF